MCSQALKPKLHTFLFIIFTANISSLKPRQFSCDSFLMVHTSIANFRFPSRYSSCSWFYSTGNSTPAQLRFSPLEKPSISFHAGYECVFWELWKLLKREWHGLSPYSYDVTWIQKFQSTRWVSLGRIHRITKSFWVGLWLWIWRKGCLDPMTTRSP